MAIGEACKHIIRVFEKTCQVTPCASMADAVTKAKQAGTSGDIVLLSPACASFDMYANYEERGNDFIARVSNLSTDKEAANG